MDYTSKQHMFIVCAYKESPYLEECIRSLLNQIIQSKIIISTSTPCEYINKIARKYNLKVVVNVGEKGIAEDWNFAYCYADTPLVTLAHQDDVYLPDYTKTILPLINKAKHPLIAFTGYDELRDGTRVHTNTLLLIKRILLWPLRFRRLQPSKFVQRRSLSLGCGISCPAVTYIRPNLPEKVFVSGYRSNIDWQAWEHLSKVEGEFLYDPHPLVLHRIHPGSETSAVLANAQRRREDYEMFCKFWPPLLAKIIAWFYRLAERNNNLEE